MNMGGVGKTVRVGIVGQFRRLGAGRNTSLVLGFCGLGLLSPINCLGSFRTNHSFKMLLYLVKTTFTKSLLVKSWLTVLDSR